MSTLFSATDPTREDCWRGIVLLGRNVASYKFALAEALLELAPEGGDFVRLDELALPYARRLAAHLQESDKQSTSRSSQFLDACRAFNGGQIQEDMLVEQTVRLGFNNVIDAFHVVGGGDVPVRFFVDERRPRGGIVVTDAFSHLLAGRQRPNLEQEVDARWRLVERAWELGVSRQLVSIDYDAVTEGLVSVDASRRRRSVAGSRAALAGYQEGECFYCRGEISLDPASEAYCDVDHFFPHALKTQGLGGRVDEVWNLVLACTDCNRGPGGKFHRVPTLPLLERLHARNEYLISSHHPLRETILAQSGRDGNARRRFLQEVDGMAISRLIHRWSPV